MVAWTYRRRRRLLIAANILLVVGIGLCAWSAWVLPVHVADAREGAGKGGHERTKADQAVTGALAQYAVIHARPWRKPLFDPKPTAVKAVKKPEPKMTAVLTGTITDPGFSRAVFRTRGGEEKLIGVGEVIDGAKVLKIAYEQVVVEFHGKELTLTPAKGATR